MLEKLFLGNKSNGAFTIVDGEEKWALTQEADELQRTATLLGFKVKREKHGYNPVKKENLYFQDRYYLLLKQELHKNLSIGCSYYHGKPWQEKIYKDTFDALKSKHKYISCVQVTHLQMKNLLLETGIDEEKIHLIPIGINLKYFQSALPDYQQALRYRYGFNPDMFVIGSFQKDGSGWDDGNEPKLIKGPDIFLEVLSRLKIKIPNIRVMLSGPSRGYMKSGLERLGIPYQHILLQNSFEVASLYHLLDVYLVTSREEGGPKAVLESMASGVPLVTTSVGQATDIVNDQVNGWIADSEDVDGLTERVMYVYNNRNNILPIIQNARTTSERYSMESLESKWNTLLNQLCNKNK